MESTVTATVVILILTLTLWSSGVISLPFLHTIPRDENGTDWGTLAYNMSDRLTRLNAHLRNQSDQMTDLKAQLDRFMQPAVAFTAGLSHEDVNTLEDGNVVKFSHVLHNAGMGYDPQTGLFTAPVTGQYLFYVNVARRTAIKTPHNCVEANLYRGKMKLMTTGSFCFHDANPSSSMIPVTLVKGETVHVRMTFGKAGSGSPLVSLSGMRI